MGAIWQSTFFLHPVWRRLDIFVPIQHPNSIFRVFDNDDQANDWNYAISVGVLILLAAFANAATCKLSGKFLLKGCEPVTAVALGYYRGSLPELAGATRSFPVTCWWSMNLTALHWTAMCTMLTRMDASVFGWLGANVAGALVGEYQYKNQFTLALARQVWRLFENTVDALFGYR
jgi:hypothetical protein